MEGIIIAPIGSLLFATFEGQNSKHSRSAVVTSDGSAKDVQNWAAAHISDIKEKESIEVIVSSINVIRPVS
jgi:hypothetical protein